MGFLARALAQAHERRAVSLLVSHLFDPATPTDELAPVVVALRELGDPSSLPALTDFVRLYHADVGPVAPVGGGEPVIERELTDQDHLNAAVEQAIETIARMGGAPERALLDRVRVHPAAPEAVRVAASRMRDGATPESPTEAPTGDGAATTGTDMTFGAPAGHLSPDAIDDAMAQRRAEVLACLRNAPSRPAQLRVRFRYDGEGRVSNVSVMPAVFQECVAPILEQVQLPTSLAVRELGTWICSTAQ